MFMIVTDPRRPRFRQEFFQVGYEPNASAINGVKAILVGTVEGRFKCDDSEFFFPHVSWDWLEDNLPDAENVLDELILRGFAWEMVWPEHDDCSTFGLTTDGELWATEFLNAPEDFDNDDEETLEFLMDLDWVKVGDARAETLPPIGRGNILTSHIHRQHGKQIKLTHWVSQATYTSEECVAALARVRVAAEAGEISLQSAGQYKRRIKERTPEL